MSLSEQEKDLIKFKSIIKAWERTFLETNSRKPDKNDIKNAPENVKEAYRNFWKMKSALSSPSLPEDVWSNNLNKTHKKISFKSSVKTTEKFCDKIRKRKILGNSEIAETPFLICQINRSVEAKTTSKEPSISSEENVSNKKEINIQFKINKIPTKLQKSDNVIKKIKSINALSPAANYNNKNLYLEQNINIAWLDRCKLDLTDNLETVENDHKAVADEPEKLNNIKNGTDAANFFHNDAVNCKYFNIDSDQCSSFNTIRDIQNANDTDGNKLEISLQPVEIVPNISKERISFENAEQDVSVESELVESPEEGVLFQLPTEEQFLNLECCENGGNKNEIPEERKSKKRKLDKNCIKKNVCTSHLQKKMAEGTLNENYVKVNIKKKKFSRGHRSVNVRKLKWNKWKQMKKSASSQLNHTLSSTCFKCGKIGHWARNCNALSRESSLFPEIEDSEEPPLPTLEEAAQLANKKSSDKLSTTVVRIYESALTVPPKESSIAQSSDEAMDSTEFVDAFFKAESENISSNVLKPLFNAAGGKPVETPREVFRALLEFGYENFRPGQETAVVRVLSGLSTLVVLPTGSGKSLCYQLPAYIYAERYKCIALVISPLVSLMEDQVTGLPSCLHAVCLHSGMTEAQKQNSLKDIRGGVAQVLLVSPEAVISSSTHGNSMLPSDLPPISFACIDEAHCLSQWSHNFRPSYLQLYKALTQKMGVKCILGLTATATQATAKDIVTHLGLESDGESVVGQTNVPRNLHISVSKDKDKDRALIQLLSGDRFRTCTSVIIYCIRRLETERLAALIRTTLQDQVVPSEDQSLKKGKKSKKRCFIWTAEAYHAGLAPARRRSIQKQFMTGKLRVVIATIAFGMGLDKPDIRAVIHYNMPKSFESYIQEIGRAGRDGLDSQCHLFLDSEGKDLPELKRHIHSNGADHHTLRKLLKKVFQPCQCSKWSEEPCRAPETPVTDEGKPCLKHEIAFSINDTVQQLDMKEENILTLLCYLEFHSEHWIAIQSPVYSLCTIRCYGGPKQMYSLACKSAPVATAIALDAKEGKKFEKTSTYEFQVVRVASYLKVPSSALKRELKALEWNDQRRKTGVLVEFSDLAFHIMAPGNLTEDKLDSILDYLHRKVSLTQMQELNNLNYLFTVFQKYSSPHYWACCDEVNAEHSENIKAAINNYFAGSETPLNELENANKISEIELSDARSQIQSIIHTHHDQNFTGRAIARIFHGIGSPRFPAEVWGRVRKFWRCLLHVDFDILIKLAKEELKEMR